MLSKKAVLVAVRADRVDLKVYTPEEKIDINGKNIRRKGWSYWGVNFRIDPNRFDFPMHMYFAVKGTRMSLFRATVIDVETYEQMRPPKNPAYLSEEFRKIEHRTYFKISKIEPMKPLEVTSLKKLSDQNFVKVIPESYVGIYDPLP
jgi:hypothetical protein